MHVSLPVSFAALVVLAFVRVGLPVAALIYGWRDAPLLAALLAYVWGSREIATWWKVANQAARRTVEEMEGDPR